MALDVIGAGNGRTGTLSTKLALEQLGFGPCYHMHELMARPERVSHWRDAFARRPVDWSALFDGYRATVDYPGFYFYDQLMEAFPAAKVILTTRPADQWYDSAYRTIYQAAPGPVQKIQILASLPFNRQLRQLMPVFKIVDYLWDEVFEGRFEDRAYAMAKFEEMNQAVIDTVPADRLLVFQASQGWEPLCRFLDVAVPPGGFPRLNERDEFATFIGNVRRGRVPLDHVTGLPTPGGAQQ